MAVSQGRSQGDQGGYGSPNRRLSGFFTEINWDVVTLFSLPEVFCGLQICQKCVGSRALPQNPLWEVTTLP